MGNAKGYILAIALPSHIHTSLYLCHEESDLISKPAIRPMGRSGSTERPIRVWHLSTKARMTPIRILPMCRAPSSIRVRSSPCSAVRTSLTVHRVPSCSMSETAISSPGRSTIRKPRSMRRRLNIWLFPERRAAIFC